MCEQPPRAPLQLRTPRVFIKAHRPRAAELPATRATAALARAKVSHVRRIELEHSHQPLVVRVVRALLQAVEDELELEVHALLGSPEVESVFAIKRRTAHYRGG